MTRPLPLAYNPALAGCTATGCNTQNTATVDGINGRRCADHPPTFDPAAAVRLAVTSGIAIATAYIRAHGESK